MMTWLDVKGQQVTVITWHGVVVTSLVSINEVNLRWARPLSTGMGDNVRVWLPEVALYFGI